MAVIPKVRPGKEAFKFLAYLEKRGKGLGPLLIATHDHPDPDALSSAWALGRLVQAVCGVRVRLAYSGVVGRRENLQMLENLRVPARPLRKSDMDSRRLAMVDTQPPFRNNRFTARRKADIIIDHHTRDRRTRADFLWIDKSLGATATMIGETLIAADVSVSRRLATAIVYGISSETQNLSRGVGARDIAIYRAFLPQADMKALWRIANPPRPASFFHTLGRGIRDAFVCRRVIGVHLRELPNPDAVAQIADFLLAHEKMHWSIVTGRYDGKLHVSLRTHSPSEDAGRLLKRILGGRNRAGGHRMMAGGSIKVANGGGELAWRELEERVLAGFLRSRGITDPQQRIFPFRHS